MNLKRHWNVPKSNSERNINHERIRFSFFFFLFLCSENCNQRRCHYRLLAKQYGSFYVPLKKLFENSSIHETWSARAFTSVHRNGVIMQTREEWRPEWKANVWSRYNRHARFSCVSSRNSSILRRARLLHVVTDKERERASYILTNRYNCWNS